MPRHDLPLADIDISPPEFWAADRPHREDVFATLRQHPPQFFEELLLEPFPKGPGYYAITRYDDVWAASRQPQLFRSGSGVNIGDLPPEINEFFGSVIAMDDPRHARLRGIVARGFTPKTIAKVDEYVRLKAIEIVARIQEQFPDGECDFVENVAAPLPLEIICEMMGIPQSDFAQILKWTNVILGVGDPEVGGTFDTLLENSMAIYAYAQALGEDRLANRQDDITSELMHAVVDGESITSQEFGSFFILLVVAGNETTRNAISHGMKVLTDLPDQKAIWWNDFEGVNRTAVEEIVRWASPVIHMRRTVAEDTELGGFPLKTGDKVVLFYSSANRDETKWANPHEFDVRRDINPAQVGFGAGGPHFCLGANLARREISMMFREISDRLPNMHITSEPDYLQSSFINGIKRMRCSWK